MLGVTADQTRHVVSDILEPDIRYIFLNVGQTNSSWPSIMLNLQNIYHGCKVHRIVI